MRLLPIISQSLLVVVAVLLMVLSIECRGENGISVAPKGTLSKPSPAAAAPRATYLTHPYNRPRNTKRSFNFRCLERSTLDDSHQPIFTGNLTIRVSPRVLPQMISRIYAIYLQDVLQTGHSIQFKSEEMPPRADAVDVGEISLETWQMPDGHEMDKGENNHHGTLYVTGVLGWFIPKRLIGQSDLPLYMPYQMFQGDISEKILEQFQMDEATEKMLQQMGKAESASFTPYYCAAGGSRSCVTLLAGYYKETLFVTRHIEKFNLSVRVIWLGANLRKVVDMLYKDYLNHPLQPPTMTEDHMNEVFPNGTAFVHRKFLVLDFSPSIVIDGAIEFSPVLMPSCKEIVQRSAIDCAYTYMPVVKYYKFPRPLKQLEKFTQNFKFEERDYRGLIKRYEGRIAALAETKPSSMVGQMAVDENEENLLNNLACDFVKEHPNSFQSGGKDHKAKPRYSIGLFLPSNGHSIYGDILHATQEAIDSINKSTSILQSIELDIHVQSISCAAQPLMRGYLSYHSIDRDSPIIGIVGPPCTHGLDSVATFSEVIAMPTISYGATATAFDPSHGYRNFFRTVGESRHFGPALIHVLEQFNWKRVATLFEEGLSSSYLTASFDSRLKEHGIEVLIHQKVPLMADTTVIVERLNDLKERRAKVILMEIYDLSTALQVMCEAKHLNMTARKGFVWIVPSWIGDFSDLPIETVVTSCSRKEIAEALDLQFSFDYPSFADDNQLLPHLGNITRATWLRQYRERLGDKPVSKYAGYIFDAVWTFAFAFHRVLTTGNMSLESSIHSSEQYPRFLEAIRETNFSGVSGQIDFHQGQSTRPQIIFTQWRGLKLYRVGGERSSTNTTMLLTPQKIIWFEGTPPTDGRAVCSVQALASFLRVDCDTAILAMTVLLSFGGALLASLAFYLYVRRFYNQKIKLSAQVMRNLGIDLLNTTSAPENLLTDWEMPKDQIMLNRKLGEGAFGTVYGGQAYIDGSQDLQAVAVKTLKIGSTSEDRLDFLSEAEAMRRFNHPNILKLLGVCLQSEPIFSVIEFMLYGDLKTYLLARRHLVKERIPDDSDVSARRLTTMTMDILRGLAYLAEQKYVHRDIACRNCLVNADRRVKIADFGMARPTGSNDYYRFSRKGLLPVRWLSPESLGSGFFTPASDIWSFGVLLFEIVSFGAFPYQGLSNNQVLEFVKNGGSMNIPEGVKPPLEGLMRSCWAPDFKKRPTALQILEFVANNPRLVAPCVDVPHFSIQFSDSESDEVFMPKGANQSPDSGVGGLGMPITRETLQQLAALPTSQAAAEVFQSRLNGSTARGGFLKATNGNGGGVPNGNGSLTYNPIEPLLLRQNSNELSSSSSSLFMRYVPMCGFLSSSSGGGKKGSSGPVVKNNNYSNYRPEHEEEERSTGSLDDSEYTRMTITEF